MDAENPVAWSFSLQAIYAPIRIHMNSTIYRLDWVMSKILNHFNQKTSGSRYGSTHNSLLDVSAIVPRSLSQNAVIKVINTLFYGG